MLHHQIQQSKSLKDLVNPYIYKLEPENVLQFKKKKIWNDPLPEALGRVYGALRLRHLLLGHRGWSVCRWASPSAGPPAAGWAAPPSALPTVAQPASLGTGCWPAQFLPLEERNEGIASAHSKFCVLPEHRSLPKEYVHRLPLMTLL